MTKKKKHFLVYLPTIIGALVLVGAIVLIVHLISNMEDKPEKKERKIQKITLAEPPPPPPPPPKVEKPPEPEPEEQIQEQAEPEPEPEAAPDAAPPGDLGLDAEGSAGSDSFGLAARKGGTGLLGGGGGDPYSWYGKLAEDEISNILADNEDLRSKGFTATVKIWVNADGSVRKFELNRSNEAEIDDLLEKLISKFKRINEPAPPGFSLDRPLLIQIKDKI